MCLVDVFDVVSCSIGILRCPIYFQKSQFQFFFQYREGQFEALLPWRQTLQLITNEVKNLCKKVNQSLLLSDLYENKTCNRLLESETSDDEVWGGHDSDQEETEYVTYLEANLNVRFKPGLFACPLVWETSIPLHPR